MENNQMDFIFKIIMIGPSSVGKTSIINQFCDEKFTESYNSTIGIDFRIKTLEVDKKLVKIQIWDTAGQERYQALTKNHYQGAHGCICVFDLTSRESFERAKSDFKKNNQYFRIPGECAFFVGNKSDLENLREVSFEEGSDFARWSECIYIETSAKQNMNIIPLYINLCKKIIQNKNIFELFDENEEKSTKKLKNSDEIKIDYNKLCCGK